MPFNDMEKTEMICTEDDASGLEPRKNVEELECSKIVGKENIKEKYNSATAGAKNKAEGGRKKNRKRPRKSSSETHKKRKSGGDDKVRSASKSLIDAYAWKICRTCVINNLWQMAWWYHTAT